MAMGKMGKMGKDKDMMEEPGMAGGYEDIFADDAGGMEGGDPFSGMFEDQMEDNPDDMLMKSLIELDYDVTPDKLEQIKMILEGGGEDTGADDMAGLTPEGVEMTDQGAAPAY